MMRNKILGASVLATMALGFVFALDLQSPANAGTTTKPLAGSGVQVSSQAASPITAGKAGYWQKGDQAFFQTSSGTQCLLNTAAILTPAAQQTGSLNVSSTIRGDGGFIGPELQTLLGGSFVTLDDSGGLVLKNINSGTGAFVGISMALAGGVSQSTMQIETNSPNNVQSSAVFVGQFSPVNAAGWCQWQMGGEALLGCKSQGVINDDCLVADIVTDSGGSINAGDVVVWSGNKQVAQSSAVADLKTLAGVALNGASGLGQTLRMCKMGKVMVNSDAGMVAGDLAATSASAAGKAKTDNTAPSGAVLGRAVEATGATIAGQTMIDVEL